METSKRRRLTPAAAAAKVENFVTEATADEHQWLHQDAILSLTTVISSLKRYQAASAVEGESAQEVRSSPLPLHSPVFSTLTCLHFARPLAGKAHELLSQ